MNESPSPFLTSPVARPAEIWFPISPRFLPILRIVGFLLLGLMVYNAFVSYHRAPAGFWIDWFRLLPPFLLPVWLLGVRPTLRARTLWSRTAVLAHWLLLGAAVLLTLLVSLRAITILFYLISHP